LDRAIGPIVLGAQSAALLCDAATCIVAEMARQLGSSGAAESGAPDGGSGMR